MDPKDKDHFKIDRASRVGKQNTEFNLQQEDSLVTNDNTDGPFSNIVFFRGREGVGG